MKLFAEGNGEISYRPEYVQPVDMFPQTTHIETVCLLSNRKPDSYVHLNLKMEDYYRIKDAEKEQGKKYSESERSVKKRGRISSGV